MPLSDKTSQLKSDENKKKINDNRVSCEDCGNIYLINKTFFSEINLKSQQRNLKSQQRQQSNQLNHEY